MKLFYAAVTVALAAATASTSLAAQDKTPVQEKAAERRGEPVKTPNAASENTYRLTYTVSESDGGKRLGVQHFAMTINPSNPRGTIKLGSKIPVVTGSYNNGGPGGAAGVQTQFTYLDVGLNIDATLTVQGNGIWLISKVEQSSIAEAPSANPDLRNDPIVRQAVLSATAGLTPGKPLLLGALDTPGSTRHLDIEVLLETVK